MKKNFAKKWPTEKELELERLNRWKYSSTKAKIDWLDDAMEFAKFKKS